MDLSGLWHLVVSPVALAARTVGVYFAMLVGFRLFGKRELGQATIFDVAMVLLIANAVQNAMVGPDTSLLGGAGRCGGAPGHERADGLPAGL